jgi:hypothetical protein
LLVSTGLVEEVEVGLQLVARHGDEAALLFASEGA